MLAHVLEQARPRLCGLADSYRTEVLVSAAQERMLLLGLDDPARYVEFLLGDPPERAALADAVRISVTSFFRDPVGLEALAKNVLTPWLEAPRHAGPLRIWVAGCATGEEVYSIAMLAYEEAARARRALDLQLFASDLDERALLVARRGVYPRSIEREVSAERLARFFVPVRGGYRVVRSVRQQAVFLCHDARKRPPLTQLDLVSCRNLLLYFEPKLRSEVVRAMATVLRRPGFLLLSRAENMGSMITHFSPVGNATGLYAARRRPAGGG